MGGASESFLEGNVWRGNIITAGGGFAGIRTQAFRPAFDASRCQGIRLRVRGGGDQRYKLIIRDSYEWNGIAWSYEFDTKSWNPLSDVTEVMAPFSEFVPTLFAQRVPDVKYNAAKLTTLQLTLSKFGYDGDLNPNFKAGEFSITLESVGVF
ncbi:unnamed protein product [Prorocentrum cordatum]|uniref:NADH:ubiquinone oxidoreductase intermediate-associated protein 30 domain-containing protein n=1 Tax=Prorocentrum cordatum TaxID=2364126 RepID=A0ABN9UL28_9DINO|nr:unnamed protein product [Polarella glacialis]